MRWTIPVARRAAITDAVAVAIAVSLPWSTSATAILIGVWIVCASFSVNREVLVDELKTPAGGLPVAMWCFAAIGMLWADVSWSERFAGFGGFHKLLVIPLLLAHFRTSDKAPWFFVGFLVSCSALLIASAYFALWPDLPWRGSKGPGAPVKDHIAQSAEFVLCALGLLTVALGELRANRTIAAFGLAFLASLFLANVVYISTARTGLFVLAFLLVLFGVRHFGWKGATGFGVGALMVSGTIWFSSPSVRAKVEAISKEVERYQSENIRTSAGERIDFWKRSGRFVAEAPVFGHGTGMIPELFRRAAVGETGFQATGSSNPHNQTLTVAIQLGVVGAVLLWALWLAHLMLFRGDSLAAWIGFVVVVQNVLGSLFNSHLSDFTHGWIYVFGVGVAGGAVRKERRGSALPRPRPVNQLRSGVETSSGVNM